MSLLPGYGEATTKICSRCGEEKSIDSFRWLHQKTRSTNAEKKKKIPICIKCERQDSITVRKLRAVSPPKPSDGRCECCGVSGVSLFLDHCHDENKFRGWICGKCNRAIGLLGDTIEGVQMAIEYLKRTTNG